MRFETSATLLRRVQSDGDQGVQRQAAARILAQILCIPRKQFIAEPQMAVPAQCVIEFEKLWNRFLDGEPLEYILGETEFYGLRFKIDERCFIPRPETELLVEEALQVIKKRSGIAGPIEGIFDIGTGSGAIAIALAKQTGIGVCAVDVSGDAIAIARENADLHGLSRQISFFEGNLLDPIINRISGGLIVANLPYIGTEKHAFLADSVKNFEPHAALFGGPDGLNLYRGMFRQIRESGMIPSALIGEIGFSQGADLSSFLDSLRVFWKGLDWELKQDLAGLDRFFIVNF